MGILKSDPRMYINKRAFVVSNAQPHWTIIGPEKPGANQKNADAPSIYADRHPHTYKDQNDTGRISPKFDIEAAYRNPTSDVNWF